MFTFKVITVSVSEGSILNKEAKPKLGVQKGNTLYLTDAPDGGLRSTPYNPDFQRQMMLAEQIMHNDREILRALAKRLPGVGSELIWSMPFTKASWRGMVDWMAYATKTRWNQRSPDLNNKTPRPI